MAVISTAIGAYEQFYDKSLLDTIKSIVATLMSLMYVYLMLLGIAFLVKCVFGARTWIKKPLDDEQTQKQQNVCVYCNTDYVIENYRPKRFVAIDTERVGAGRRGSIDMLARVSLVDEHGQVIVDKFVKPIYQVTDYRTKWSGIRREDLIDGDDFHSVRQLVAYIIEDRILVGHDLTQDLNVLHLNHPLKDVRDTAMYSKFRGILNPHEKPSLKRLARDKLQTTIQSNEHDSVEDVRTAMSLYLKYAGAWEAGLVK